MRTFLFLLLSFTASAQVALPPEQFLFLENGTLKVGVDRAKGAAITWISSKSSPKNIVNSYDPGRLIQQSYYAGRKLDRRKDGQHKAWSPWTWNPIQGGGVGSWAQVLSLEKKDGLIFSETIPKLWDMTDENAEATMRQWTGFEKGMPNVLVVRCQLVCTRHQEDRWGPAVDRPQEVPACYFTRNFDSFKSYQGNGKWQTHKQEPGPPWGAIRKNVPTSFACFEKNGQGAAVFCPYAKSCLLYTSPSPRD